MNEITKGKLGKRVLLIGLEPKFVIHEHAPGAKLCFNTQPDDTAKSVQRWV